jgi:carbamoyl-phosphate synthase large subunit
VELVRGFRDAYQRLGLAGRILATDVDWLAPAMHEVDEAYLVPPSKTPEYVAAIMGICQTQGVRILLPLVDYDIPVLARHRGALEATGAYVGVVDPAAAEICGDKWLAYQFFQTLGLAVPQSWLPEQLHDPRLQLPVLVKPRDGSAAANVFKVDDPHQLHFFAHYVPRAIVQEYLPGPEVTSDVVCDRRGRVLAVVCRQRIAVRGGEAMKSVTIRHEGIEAACREIARQLPARGPITVQCMLKDHQPHFIEINARLGGGVTLAVAAGVNVPALLLADAADMSVEDYLSPTYVEGLYMTRCDESTFLTEQHREQIVRRHL